MKLQADRKPGGDPDLSVSQDVVGASENMVSSRRRTERSRHITSTVSCLGYLPLYPFLSFLP